MALPNGDLITTVFDPQMAYPVDKRMQVDTLNSRDSMSMFIRWEGMEVYVLENSKKYILQGGRSNEYWKETGTGTGTGGTTFVGQFESAALLPTTGRSPGDYAFVGTGDDFVQYNWDNIANQWVMAEGQTDMASEFFHIGYKAPLRRPVIFPLLPKDVLVQESGDFVFAHETAVARFIFTGEVTAIRGIETAAADREIKLVNRTGSDIPLRDKASGIPSGSGFDFGGTDYTWLNGSEITLKGNGTYWELAPNNQIAFSDHLDSVNAKDTIGSDGKRTITGILDRFTSKEISFKEIDRLPNGQSPADEMVNNLTLFKIGDKYLMNSDLIERPIVNVKMFGAKGDWVNDDTIPIQQAVNFAASIGASVYVPAGNYKLTDTINFFPRCVLYGDGKKTTIFKSEITGDKNVLNFPPGGGINTWGYSIEGFLDGTGTEGYGIRIDDCNVNTIEGIDIRYLGGGAIWITDNYVNWISNCYFAFNNRSDTYNSTDNAVVNVPYSPSGNNLNMSKVYISNHRNMDGVRFTGYNGNFRGVIVESGRDGIVIGQKNRPTRSITIDTCYFENSGGYDVRIVEAMNVRVSATFHSNYERTLGNLFISNLRNAEFNNCSFGSSGIFIDSDALTSRNNILFNSCINVSFNTVNISGITIQNENSFDYQKESNGSTNLIPYSDDLSKWTKANNALTNQDAVFVDGTPCYTLISVNDSDSISYILGDHTGQLCFSLFVKIKSPLLYSKLQLNGKRKSDGVNETVSRISLRQISNVNTPEWERVFISANTDHTELTLIMTGRGNGIEVCRMQFEKGVLYPSEAIYTNGVTIREKQKEVINGNLIVNGGISSYNQSGEPYKFNIDGNGFLLPIPISRQILDTQNSIQTGYYTTSGIVTPSATAYRVIPQKINKYEPITYSGPGPLATTVARILFFDANGNHLSNILSTSTSEREVTFTPPLGADTFSINLVIGSSSSIDLYKESVMVNYGSTAFPYEKYAPQWKFDYQGNGGKVFRLREDERGIDFVDSVVPNASTTERGIIEQATDAETITGTDTERAVSPANLQAKLNALILSATATLDFPTIAAGETERLTATVTGAALLDPVVVSGPDNIYNSNNSTIDAWVSAANTVTVRVRNNGASSIDPGEGQFKIKVFK